MPLPESFLLGATLSAHPHEGDALGPVSGCWEADIALARKLGMNALLVPLSWARIQPEPDRFDQEALDHYRAVFGELQSGGIQPVCVLFDGGAPAWFIGAGGWASKQAPARFAAYASQAGAALCAQCAHWTPLLEPRQIWERQYQRRMGRRGAWKNMVAAQREAAQALRQASGAARVGVSVEAVVYTPEDPDSAWDVQAAESGQPVANLGFLEAAGPADFVLASWLGVRVVRFSLFCRRNGRARVMPGEEAPAKGLEAFGEALAMVQSARLPVMLLGGGAAEDGASPRPTPTFQEYLSFVQQRQTPEDTLSPLTGYFHRSLLDVDGSDWAQVRLVCGVAEVPACPDRAAPQRSE